MNIWEIMVRDSSKKGSLEGVAFLTLRFTGTIEGAIAHLRQTYPDVVWEETHTDDYCCGRSTDGVYEFDIIEKEKEEDYY